MNKGTLFVLTGPSGSGKGTVLGAYKDAHDFYYSVSNTTRAPRPGEVDGVHYHFISREAFEEQIRRGGMLEYAEYCGNYYGTPRDRAEEQMAAGRSVLLEIEVQGAMQVKRQAPGAALIFIAPPSMAVLRQRLTGRGTESAEAVEKRLQKAAEEVAALEGFDFVVVNDKVEQAAADLAAIVDACEKRDEEALLRLKAQAGQLKKTLIKEFSL